MQMGPWLAGWAGLGWAQNYREKKLSGGLVFGRRARGRCASAGRGGTVGGGWAGYKLYMGCMNMGEGAGVGESARCTVRRRL